jgi:hypothetical protein
LSKVPGWNLLRNFFTRRKRKAEGQADELVTLMLERLQQDQVTDAAAIKFVRSRFRDRMVSHLSIAPWHGFAFSTLSLISIAGAVAISSLAASGDTTSGLVVALGLLIAATTAMNQIWQFQKRSTTRFRAGNSLRQEGWDYVTKQGRYAMCEPGDSFGIFYDAVWRIEAPADAISEAETDTSKQ